MYSIPGNVGQERESKESLIKTEQEKETKERRSAKTIASSTPS
jgi:hypothetical protein